MSEKPNNNDDTNFYALLHLWAARSSSVAFGMVIPALLGVWLDRQLGTVALFAILGVILGMVLAFWQLFKFAKSE